jgi:cysteinyl-tRNA synthetase
MHWSSRWSEGFPGWHLECSAMSSKYLGEEFDIHGGGMDLLFPHHECEIAQTVAASGKESVRYWLHNNMITVSGQKMGKSLGNFITLEEFFTGNHKGLEKAYSPMAIRFFILQAHYRSTLDFSNEALQASEKGLQRLFTAIKTLSQLKATGTSGEYVANLRVKCYEAINDDLNSPILIAHLFDGVRLINAVKDGHESISPDELENLQNLYKTFVGEILGLQDETASETDVQLIDGLVNMVLEMRIEAKNRKDFAASDQIRNQLLQLGIEVKDRKDGFDWSKKQS